MAALTETEVYDMCDKWTTMTTEEVKADYDKWSDTYDQDFVNQGYRGPSLVAPFVDKEFPDKNARILDVLAGTGMLGLEMKKLGFTRVDGLDGNLKMLAKAAERDVYQSYICTFLTPNIPTMIAEGYYDGLVLSGGFVPGHIKSDAANEFVRLLKSGGKCVLIINGRLKLEYEPDLEENLEKIKGWKLLKRDKVEKYNFNAPGIILVFQKE